MVFVPDASHADPSAWRIAMDASEGTLSMTTSKGPRLLHELPCFHGSFYLSPPGLLAGFTLQLPLPVYPSWLQEDEAPVLFWESVDLETGHAPNEVMGNARLRLGRRETSATVSALCTEVPVAGTGRSYLKIVLETVFPSVSLRWPAEAWQRLRPVTLKLFTEIRPADPPESRWPVPEQRDR
ncbi:hypothetical protein AB0C10_12685 [Microbispora amethystogenes]|uniref:Uncharacterized protein n=1 Tax=Microbispora amethystogenes TaxID=1427754 RepID=A0ABQ4F526_9ACTN|nr:hypothetical protein [Microbispora amethystogenes]GIH29906.1 hypothetical protein Mam01_00700 [Microbispora amethystogenes]